jgi:3-methyladenine DNA glycosylase Mpg
MGTSSAPASRGLTPRTRVLFAPAGRAYVYLRYGIHTWWLDPLASPAASSSAR